MIVLDCADDEIKVSVCKARSHLPELGGLQHPVPAATSEIEDHLGWRRELGHREAAPAAVGKKEVIPKVAAVGMSAYGGVSRQTH